MSGARTSSVGRLTAACCGPRRRRARGAGGRYGGSSCQKKRFFPHAFFKSGKNYTIAVNRHFLNRMTAHVNDTGRKHKKKQNNERAVQKDRQKGNKMKKKHKKGSRPRKGQGDKSKKASQGGQHGTQEVPTRPETRNDCQFAPNKSYSCQLSQLTTFAAWTLRRRHPKICASHTFSLGCLFETSENKNKSPPLPVRNVIHLEKKI